jgi:hypothetical protein
MITTITILKFSQVLYFKINGSGKRGFFFMKKKEDEQIMV